MSVPKNLHNKPCHFRKICIINHVSSEAPTTGRDDAIGDNFPLRLFCPNSKGLYLPSQ